MKWEDMEEAQEAAAQEVEVAVQEVIVVQEAEVAVQV